MAHPTVQEVVSTGRVTKVVVPVQGFKATKPDTSIKGTKETREATTIRGINNNNNNNNNSRVTRAIPSR